MKYAVLAALVVLISTLAEGAVVCYYSSWSAYREGGGKFEIEDIDPFLCTHVVYAFATLGELNRITWADRWNDLCGETRNCGYQRFTALKGLNPNLKTLISIGGWNDGSIKFSNMAGDAAARSTFVNSVINFLENHNFDGLDMDWEYPTTRGGVPEDKENFATLLEELAAALRSSGFLLTVSVSPNKDVIDSAYDVPRISEAVDAIHLMSYDFHGPWDPVTHHHTSLYPYPEDVDNNAYLNVDFAVNYWLDQGAAPSKLVMGTATFARTWTLDDSSNTGMYASASQPGIAGPYTKSPGTLGYNELCERNLNSPWVVVNEPDMNEPYAYDLSLDNIWASFDDSVSLVNKASYALAKNLAGVAAWSIDTDDFSGACGSGPFPLIQTLKNTINGMKSLQHKRLSKPRLPRFAAPESAATEHCQQPGNNPEPNDCKIYYKCDLEGGSYTEEIGYCPEDTLFNPESRVCDRRFAVCAFGGDVCPNDCRI